MQHGFSTVPFFFVCLFKGKLWKKVSSHREKFISTQTFHTQNILSTEISILHIIYISLNNLADNQVALYYHL